MQVSSVDQRVPRTVATLLLPCVWKRPPLSAPQTRRFLGFGFAEAAAVARGRQSSSPASVSAVIPPRSCRTRNLPPPKVPDCVLPPTCEGQHDAARRGVDERAERQFDAASSVV